MLTPKTLTPAERADYCAELIEVLEDLNKLGPEYFAMKIRLMAQCGRELLAEIERKRERETIRP